MLQSKFETDEVLTKALYGNLSPESIDTPQRIGYLTKQGQYPINNLNFSSLKRVLLERTSVIYKLLFLFLISQVEQSRHGNAECLCLRTTLFFITRNQRLVTFTFIDIFLMKIGNSDSHQPT
jgi:hypothetical protein